MRTALQWLVFGAVAYACWQVAPIYIHSRQFEERLEALARQSVNDRDGLVIQRTLELASTLALPLTASGITVRRLQAHTYIDAAYTAELNLLPGVTIPWSFEANVDGHVIESHTASDFVPGF